MSQSQAAPMLDDFSGQLAAMLQSIGAQTPVTVARNVRVKQSSEPVFERKAAELAAHARRSSGVRSFSYSRSGAGRGEGGVEYLLYEQWSTPGAARDFWNSPAARTFVSEIRDALAAPPQTGIFHDPESSAIVPLPRTGQTGAWDTSGREIPARGTGQDGEFQFGAPWPFPRFQENNDGTVTDRLTGLIWLRNADPFGELQLEESLRRTRALASGQYGLSDGSRAGDWRMPNIRELLSMIDYGSVAPIIARDHPFENVRCAIYWTSTTLTPAPYLSWQMTLGIGPTVFDLKLSSNRAWPVRGEGRVLKTGQKLTWDAKGDPIPSQGTGQDGDLQAGVAPPDQRFIDNNDGTVTDKVTDLVWLKSGNSFGMRTWDQALEICNSLASGEHGLADASVEGDWRLPNIREMESLIDYNNVGPCLPQGHPFTDVRPSSYWTSTSVTSAPTEAMFVILGVGPSIFESKEHPFFIWPVRNKKPGR